MHTWKSVWKERFVKKKKKEKPYGKQNSSLYFTYTLLCVMGVSLFFFFFYLRSNTGNKTQQEETHGQKNKDIISLKHQQNKSLYWKKIHYNCLPCAFQQVLWEEQDWQKATTTTFTTWDRNTQFATCYRARWPLSPAGTLFPLCFCHLVVWDHPRGTPRSCPAASAEPPQQHCLCRCSVCCPHTLPYVYKHVYMYCPIQLRCQYKVESSLLSHILALRQGLFSSGTEVTVSYIFKLMSLWCFTETQKASEQGLCLENHLLMKWWSSALFYNQIPISFKKTNLKPV